jgi:hypothetical protein
MLEGVTIVRRLKHFQAPVKLIIALLGPSLLLKTENFDYHCSSKSGICIHHFDTIFSHFNFLISRKRSKQ